MKRELNPALVAIVLIALVAVVGGWIYYGSQPHTPAGIKYTPGVPPWMEKGASGHYKPTPDYPSGGAPTAPSPGRPPMSPPAINGR